MTPGPTNGDGMADGLLGEESTTKSTKNKVLPWHVLKSTSITSIEHPFLVQDLTKGLDFLGGENRVKRIIAKQDDASSLELSLNPEDPMCRPIKSNVAGTGDILLKINVPKRTGRKRKRGSNEPWTDAEDQAGDMFIQQSQFISSLQENPDSYSFEVIGAVDRTHRFRDLADFQYSVGQDPLTHEIESSLLDLDYKKIKNFKLDIGKAPGETTGLFPPPFFTQQSLPFNYGYQQNPAVQLGLDAAGQPLLMNTQQAPKIFTARIQYNVETVPQGVDSKAPDLSTQEPALQKTVDTIKELMKTRPIWTRRALMNTVKSRDTVVKLATQYVGYMFTSGPWRDTIIRYGLDPRTDASCRIYQSFGFQIVAQEPGEEGVNTNWVEDKVKFRRDNRSNPPTTNSHIFDGKTLVRDGKVWQVCDVTDPLLQKLLATKDIRSTCDIRCDGWYHNGLWAKVKTIMRAKIRTLMEGKIPHDMDFARLLQIPDVLDNLDRSGSGVGGDSIVGVDEDATPADRALAHEVRQRASAKHSGKKPVPRRRGELSSLTLLGGMRIGVDGPGLGTGADVVDDLEDFSTAETRQVLDPDLTAEADIGDVDDDDDDDDDDDEMTGLSAGRVDVVPVDEDDTDVDDDEDEDDSSE